MTAEELGISGERPQENFGSARLKSRSSGVVTRAQTLGVSLIRKEAVCDNEGASERV